MAANVWGFLVFIPIREYAAHLGSVNKGLISKQGTQ